MSSMAKVRVKGHAVRLGLDVSHLEAPTVHPEPDLVITPPRAEFLRRAAPAIAAAWFTLRGYATVTAAEEQKYDLLVTFPDGIKRLQVKSTTFRTASGRWQVKIGRRPYSLDKTAGRAPYDPDTYPEHRVGDAASLLTWGDG